MDGQLNSLLPQSARVFHIVPYDLYCPSVQEDLQGRPCQACSLYFASKKMLQQHRRMHRKNDPPGAPIIDHLVVPRRIVIRLANEVLLITGDHPDGEAADWVNIEDIATEQHKNIPPDSVPFACPTINTTLATAVE